MPPHAAAECSLQWAVVLAVVPSTAKAEVSGQYADVPLLANADFFNWKSKGTSSCTGCLEQQVYCVIFSTLALDGTFWAE